MKCMQINFGGRGFSSFGDFCSFVVCLQNGPNFPLDHGLESMGIEK